MRVKVFLFACFLVAFPFSAYAQTVIEVSPLGYDFGDVQVGSPGSTIITISNIDGQDLVIQSVSLSGDDGFIITQWPDSVLLSGYSTDVEITFNPPAIGSYSSTLFIESNDPDFPFIEVLLTSVGVSQEQPPMSVSDILAFFDASVADGTLCGYGPGNSADGRRGALRNQIEAAGDMIDAGDLAGACQQLTDAYGRCDGLPRPPEFVACPAAAALAEKVLDLMGEVGCE